MHNVCYSLAEKTPMKDREIFMNKTETVTFSDWICSVKLFLRISSTEGVFKPRDDSKDWTQSPYPVSWTTGSSHLNHSDGINVFMLKTQCFHTTKALLAKTSQITIMKEG